MRFCGTVRSEHFAEGKTHGVPSVVRGHGQELAMINPYRILSEHLPERVDPTRASLSTEPKALRAWLEGLPRANQQVYVGELQRALAEFRTRRFDGFSRLETMEILRPMLLEVIGLMTGRLQGVAFPLTGARADAARQLLDLVRDMALAYRMAVSEACAPNGRVPFMRGKQVTLALVRAVYHHVRWLTTSYFLYRSPEPGTWAQLYALSTFAAAHKLDTKAIEDKSERRELTVALMQNQAIMLSLANPYRFSQRELVELWALTRDTASLIELTPQRFSAAGALVLIDKDLPPAFASRAPDPDEGDVFWVDLRKLNDLVRAAISHAGAAHEALMRLSRDYQLSMPVSLLARVLEGWSQDVSRGYTRLDAGHTMDSALGLTAVHSQLSGSRTVDTTTEAASSSNIRIGERASWANLPSLDATHAQTAEVQVQDQSLGGYRLRWKAEHGVRVRIGELVGLALPLASDIPRDWAIGTVRWLRYDDDGAVEAGVDLVARRSRAATLRGLSVSGGAEGSSRALALTALCDPIGTDSDEILLVDGLTGLETPQVEVTCQGERWDVTQYDSVQIYKLGALRPRRRVGDYLLVAPGSA